ncbi:helix-turn-helix domain-containing protein [Corynebacterium rouxii]|uniref:Helix-turn-helix domain-containing protein n=1 Tax=Corynebacterium rouxii TaxID=2719119 RepID=A0A6I8MGV5_9CORY|nr:helix-turn-helix domain-containing protein [Corynebacterium rouxii]MDT9409715.1 helix-turn-helix domain-containing protein [Corynebacterium rouxii]MDT9411948.1 helix-turn-helix domain-containing protein [Corynebacterium rouxii]VZH86329.1 hypothetical protein FRC0190_02244 [Corynebacterium rouxii]
MASTAHHHRRIPVFDSIYAQAQQLEPLDIEASAMGIRQADGTFSPLPDAIQNILSSVLDSLVRGETIGLYKIPDELTSTSAAELLEISRPTLMKWVREGKINSFKIGSHNRFYRKDVLRLKEKRRQEQLQAFTTLRALDQESHIED